MKYIRTMGFVAVLAFAGLVHAQIAAPIPQPTLLTYLDQLTQWQRDAAAIQPTATNAREVVFRDSLRGNAAKVLQSGFVFMRSVAGAEPATVTVDPESTRQRLLQQIAATKQRIAALTDRDAVRIEQARLQLMQTILDNLNAASNKSPNKLLYTIQSLSRSIPELDGDAPNVAEEAVFTKGPVTSIFGLSASAFEVARKQRELDQAIDKTTQLKKQSMELMKLLRSGLGEEAPAEETKKTEEATPVAPMTIDERVGAYKQLGVTIVPLAESMRWIDASKQTMKEWREVLTQHQNEVLRKLGIRVGVLCASLAITLILSEVVERMINRMNDTKRQRQMHTVRRIITGIAVLIILLANFISDFGSFVTFAGFLTAGLAVALRSDTE